MLEYLIPELIGLIQPTRFPFTKIIEYSRISWCNRRISLIDDDGHLWIYNRKLGSDFINVMELGTLVKSCIVDNWGLFILTTKGSLYRVKSTLKHWSLIGDGLAKVCLIDDTYLLALTDRGEVWLHHKTNKFTLPGHQIVDIGGNPACALTSDGQWINLEGSITIVVAPTVIALVHIQNHTFCMQRDGTFIAPNNPGIRLTHLARNNISRSPDGHFFDSKGVKIRLGDKRYELPTEIRNLTNLR